MFFVKLQRIDNTQHFIDVAAKWQVIDHLVLDRAFFINQKRTT